MEGLLYSADFEKMNDQYMSVFILIYCTKWYTRKFSHIIIGEIIMPKFNIVNCELVGTTVNTFCVLRLTKSSCL